jgi:DNA-binding FadR family transcriptional regulator
MPAHRKVMSDLAEMFAEVFRARQAIPTDKQLARRAGVSPETVRNYMRRIRRDCVASNETTTTAGTIAGDVSSGNPTQSRDSEVPGPMVSAD